MQTKDMQTKDPALTKTRIKDDDQIDNDNHSLVATDYDKHGFDENEDVTATMQESVIGSESLDQHPALQADAAADHQDHHERVSDTPQQTAMHSSNRETANHDAIEDNTTINKGTDTFEEGIVETEHVNDDDNPARQPDRRDQEGGSPFDDNINEETVGSVAPKSDGITDQNRYANIDNAQTRILTPDEKGDESVQPRGMGE